MTEEDGGEVKVSSREDTGRGRWQGEGEGGGEERNRE